LKKAVISVLNFGKTLWRNRALICALVKVLVSDIQTVKDDLQAVLNKYTVRGA
jgi:hypothetical protein